MTQTIQNQILNFGKVYEDLLLIHDSNLLFWSEKSEQDAETASHYLNMFKLQCSKVGLYCKHCRKAAEFLPIWQRISFRQSKLENIQEFYAETETCEDVVKLLSSVNQKLQNVNTIEEDYSRCIESLVNTTADNKRTIFLSLREQLLNVSIKS